MTTDSASTSSSALLAGSNRRILVVLFAITSCSSIAGSLASSSRVYLYEQSRCRTHYALTDSSQPGIRASIDESLCKIDAVQASVATFVGLAHFFNAISALIVLAPYQKLLPVLGLRRLLVLNLSCSAAGVAFLTLIFYQQQPWDAGVSLTSAIFDLIGGGEAVLMALLYTVIAQVCQSQDLSETYYYQTALVHVSLVVGATIGSFLLRHNVWLLNLCAVGTYLITAGLALFIPVQQGTEDNMNTSSEQLSQFARNTEHKASAESTLTILIKSFSNRDTWDLVLSMGSMSRVPMICTALYFYLSVVWRIDSLYPQYTSVTLSWSLASVNQFLAFQDLLGWLVLLSLPTLRRYLLCHIKSVSRQDLIVAAVCLIFNAIGAMGVAISTFTAPYLIFMSIYHMGQGVTDSLRSYGTQHLGEGETAREFYTHLSFTLAIAKIVGSPLWSLAYSTLLAVGAPTRILFIALSVLLALGALTTRAMKTTSYEPLEQIG